MYVGNVFFPGAVVFAFPIVISPPSNIRKFLVTSHTVPMYVRNAHPTFSRHFRSHFSFLYSSFSHPLCAGKDSRRWTAFLKGFSWPAHWIKDSPPMDLSPFYPLARRTINFSFSPHICGERKRMRLVAFLTAKVSRWEGGECERCPSFFRAS